jgi:hypothetical protein
MKMPACLCVAVMFVLGCATGTLAARMPAVQGNVEVNVGDDVTRDVKFNVKIDNDGSVKGDMTFVDPSVTQDFDPDAQDAGNPTGLAMRAEFDCLVVNGNLAVMGGLVVESNLPDRVGQRVLLIAEDNGEGSNALPDRLGWGLYGDTRRTWKPSDAEVEGDEGASLTWIAKDAEREDDAGVPAGEPVAQNTIVDCASFPVSAYALVDIQGEGGNIQITE